MSRDAVTDLGTGLRVRTVGGTSERDERPGPADLMTFGDIRRRLGVARQRATEITNHWEFPRPWFVSEDRTVRLWLRSEVDAWFAAKRPG